MTAPVEPDPGPDLEPDDADGPAPGYAYPITRFLAVLGVLWIVSALTIAHLPRNSGYPAPPVEFPGDRFLEGWVHYDAGWYLNIATNGYWWRPGEASSVAFFPTYPLLMKAVHSVAPWLDLALVGIGLTVAAGLVATVLLYRWACRVTSVAVARTTVLLLIVYPYAWYLFGAVYADAVFLAFVLGAFLLLEQDRPVLAGLLAIAATAARPVGTGVVLGLVAVVLERREIVVIPVLDRARADGWKAAWAERRGNLLPGIHLRRLRVRDLGVGLSMLGLLGWMLYLARTFGDPALFVKAQAAPGWNQEQGLRVWIKGPWLRGLTNVPTYLGDLTGGQYDAFTYTLGTTFQALLVIASLCCIPLVIRRLGWGYALYVVGVVGIPILGSKDWQGTGRYLLAAFPVMVVVAGWLRERRSVRFRTGWYAVSALLLMFLTSGFARAFYLA